MHSNTADLRNITTMLVLCVGLSATAQTPDSSNREALDERSEQAFQNLDEALNPDLLTDESEADSDDPVDETDDDADPNMKNDDESDGQTSLDYEALDEPEDNQARSDTSPDNAETLAPQPDKQPTQQELYQRILAEEAAAEARRQSRIEANTNWVEEESEHIHYLDQAPTTVIIQRQDDSPRARRNSNYRYGSWRFVPSHGHAHGPRTHVHRHDRRARNARRAKARKVRARKASRKARRKGKGDSRRKRRARFRTSGQR
jgi:hypothetical protein